MLHLCLFIQLQLIKNYEYQLCYFLIDKRIHADVVIKIQCIKNKICVKYNNPLPVFQVSFIPSEGTIAHTFLNIPLEILFTHTSTCTYRYRYL